MTFSALLGRAQTVGRRHAGLSPGQYRAPRHGSLPAGLGPPPPGGPRRVSGGGRLRAASRLRGIGGLDHGIEKHAFRRFLLGGHGSLYTLRPHAGERPPSLRRALVSRRLRIVRPCPAQQDRHRDAAGGAAGDLLVAEGTVVLETRPPAAGALLPRRRPGRHDDRPGRARYGGGGQRLRLRIPRTLPDRRTGGLVLPGQARLAAGPGLLLSALAGQPGGVAAVPVPRGGVVAVGRGVVAARALERSPGGAALLHRELVSGAGFHQRLFLKVFFRRRPFPIPGQLGDRDVVLGRRGIVAFAR